MALDLNTLHKLLDFLEEMVDELQEREITRAKLEANTDLRYSVERRLQMAIEAIINIAEHIVAGANLGHTDTAKDAIITLGKHKIIPRDLSEKLGKAADMRNILVHHYVDVDLGEVVRATASGLGDLREFAKQISLFLEKQKK